jgi:hypothetical protein
MNGAPGRGGVRVTPWSTRWDCIEHGAPGLVVDTMKETAMRLSADGKLVWDGEGD